MSVKKLEMNKITVDEDYSETNPRSREEFAKEFIHSYDGALKRIMRGERRSDTKNFINQLMKEIEEKQNEEN